MQKQERIDNRYEVLAELGSGGMGTVYKVHDALNDRVVALKQLQNPSPDVVASFEREFALLASLRHENLARVFDFTHKESLCYFTMEFVDGRPIDTLKKNLRLDPKAVFPLMRQMLSALGYIHSKGILHGDLKPSNILVEQKDRIGWRVRLLDFGLSRSVSGQAVATGGTPEYSAPEIFGSGSVDERADFYSLGVVLYELLSGSNPFANSDPAKVIALQKEKKPEPLENLNSAVPAPVPEIVAGLTAKDPAHRYRRADEILAKLPGRETKPGGVFRNDVFVGREHELNQLKRAFIRSTDGKGSEIVISGAQGTGKTRLLEEFRAYVQLEKGHFVLVDPQGFDQSAGGLSLLFRQLVFLLGSDHNLVLEYRNDLEPYLGDSRERRLHERQSALINLAEFVLRAAGEFRLVIAVDNWSRSEGPLREFSKYVCRLLRSAVHEAKLLFCVAARAGVEQVSEGLGLEAAGEHVVLENFDRNQLISYAADVLSGEAPEKDLVDFLFEHTNGNPFFAAEMMRFVLESGALKQKAGRWAFDPPSDLVVPDRVEKIFEQILSMLDPSEREILDAGAAAREAFTAAFAGYVSGRPQEQAREILERLTERRILARADGAWYFRQGGLKSRLRETLADPTTAHTRAAEYFENLEDAAPEDLAHHYVGIGADEKAVPVLIASGDRAASLFNEKQAAGFYTNAYRLMKEGPSPDAGRLISVLEKSAAALGRLGEREAELEAIEAMETVAARSEDPEKQAEVCLVRARFYYEVSDLESMPASVERCLQLQGAGGTLAADAHFYRGQYHFAAGRFDEALRSYLEAENSAQDDEQRVRIKNGIGVSLASGGRLDEALDCFREVADLAGACGDVDVQIKALFNIGLIHRRNGRNALALEHYEKGHDLARRINSKPHLLMYYSAVESIYSLRRDYGSAMDFALRSLDIARTMGDRRKERFALSELTNICLETGLLDRADEYLKESLARAKQIGNDAALSVVHHHRARIQLGRDRASEALDAIGKAHRFAEKAGDRKLVVLYRIHEARILQHRGDFHESVRLLRAELADSPEEQKIYGLSVLAFGLAQTGEQDEALGRVRELWELIGERGEFEHPEEEIFFNAYKALKTLVLAGKKMENVETFPFLERARNAVVRIAETIPALDQRQSFFAIPLNRSILDEFQSVSAAQQQSHSASFESLFEISKAINSILDPERLFEKIMDLAIETTGADRGMILLLADDDSENLEIRVARNIEKETVEDARDISRSIVEDVYRQNVSVLSSNANMDERFRNRKSIVKYNIRSIMCVPLRSKERVTGTVYLDKRYDQESFTGYNLRFLESFANLAAVAIDNARMYQELRDEKEQLVVENRMLQLEVKERFLFDDIVGQSRAMETVEKGIRAALNNTVTVLIQGESGTGKELIARAIAYNGNRKERRFVAIDCGALSENLLESELFGHKKGAFTGATSDKRGLFEEADGGTIFLDEITNTTPHLQSRLLRVIQEGEIRRVGETSVRKVDVRVIAATNRDLKTEVKEGRFREDLYYRLNVLPIRVPPLRERREDVPFLIRHFLDRFRESLGKEIKRISEPAMRALTRFDWPGNVRELENILQRMVIFSDGEELKLENIPEEIKGETAFGSKKVSMTVGGGNHLETLQDLENATLRLETDFYREVLEKADGNKTRAAEMLGINRTTLNDRLRKIGLL